MKAIAIFTLVICCIGVESLPRVREKRKTNDCSSLVVPGGKIYQMFYTYKTVGRWGEIKGAQSSWQEARVACQDLGGDLAEPSTREEEDKILAAFDKAVSGGTLRWNWQFWIGVKKNSQRPEWVSGNKIELDSDLKFTPHSYWNSTTSTGCGTIKSNGIDFWSCRKGNAHGHVCKFDDASPISPICIQ